MFSLLLLQKTHYSVVQVTQHAEAMLQSQHYNSELVRAIAENVTLAWQQLMYHAEERQKLVMASTNWYKTAEQVGFLCGGCPCFCSVASNQRVIIAA